MNSIVRRMKYYVLEVQERVNAVMSCHVMIDVANIPTHCYICTVQYNHDQVPLIVGRSRVNDATAPRVSKNM